MQFRTLDDLKEVIKEYEVMLMRPTRRLSHPTLYRRRDAGANERVIKGVRVKDWFFSEDEKWVLPHDQMGLSFSATFKNLKDVYRLKQRHNKDKLIDIYWVLEQADLPPGLKFVEDRHKNGHYFLTVTEQISLLQLVSKLRMLAHRMSVIRNGGKTL